MRKVSEINFCANPLYKVRIKKYDSESRKFKKVPAFFVSLDGNNKRDIEAINSAAQQWKNALYTKSISTAAGWMSNNKFVKVYALTEQTDSFEELNPSKILGLAEIRELQEDGNELSYLQVRPNAQNVNSENSEYKKIGTSIHKSLQKIYNQIFLESVKDENIEKFHKHNGFIEFADTKGFFIWYNNIFERLDLIIRNFMFKHNLL